MHFTEMPYRRITFEEIEQRYQELFQEIRDISGEDECLAVLKKRSRLLQDMTPMELCYVRHDMDLNDSFYAKEQDYYDSIGPRVSDLSRQFDRLLIESPFCSQFKKITGDFAWALIQADLKCHDGRIIPLEQEENALMNRYSLLSANGKAEYNGSRVSRNSLSLEQQSPDRELRRRVFRALDESWEAQREELESLFDGLVKNRDRQAKLLGFSDYAKLSYPRMNRIGYTPEDVSVFREQVKAYVVPVAAALHERRRKRLGLEHLYTCDSKISFLEGNPVPLGDNTFCLEMTRRMYKDLSCETGEYIDFLLDHGLYDVEVRDGKCGGGYCTQFEAYRAPFIFANFDGTIENAYIMCHEGGHAFYFYLKRNEEIRERGRFTAEAAETHAMSMEFFLAPYMELFFGERAEDYRRMHLENAVSLIISECQQDEFQQIIYEQPYLTAEQRNEVWVRLEQEYFPFREYTSEERKRLGSRWQRIIHFYQYPFYAIDYALAQVCALEYYQWMKRDFDGAWKSYLTFCRRTGELSFPETVRASGLGDPFEEESLKKLMVWLQSQL